MSTIMPPLMEAAGKLSPDGRVVIYEPILNWSDPDQRRQLRREHQRVRRQEKRAERQVVIGQNQRAFSGRVEILTNLHDLIMHEGRVVVTTHGRQAWRTQFTGTLQCGDHQYRGHFIVLFDRRAASTDECAEIIWTGSDWRVHIWRASPNNQQEPVALEVIA